MVSIAGFGANIESLISGLGETISNRLANAGTYLSEKLNDVFSTLIAGIRAFLSWIAEKIWLVINKIYEFGMRLLSNYYDLMMHKPMEGLRLTGNLLIWFS